MNKKSSMSEGEVIMKNPFTDDIDLRLINAYLCGESYVLARWENDDVKTLELLYRRFLYLNINYPKESFAPSTCIDEYWHAHILHTKKYMDDCNQIAGHYLHHYPADALNPGEDKEKLQLAFQNTCDRYEKTFGEPLLIFRDDALSETLK